VDVGCTEAADAELVRMIERRASREPDRDEKEELWKASVAAYHERQEAERRAAWASFHEGQAERHRRTLQDLVEHHEHEAAKLMDVRPEGAG
jgi:hypothetical protein